MKKRATKTVIKNYLLLIGSETQIFIFVKRSHLKQQPNEKNHFTRFYRIDFISECTK